jgi:hypothetical protein
MKTLADAWRWYQAVRGQLRLIGRLARKHWNELPWQGALGQDQAFLDARPEAVVADAQFGADHLDDLAVLVLFSVFEAQRRRYVAEAVQQEAAGLRHYALRLAAAEMLQRIEEGSFFRVLEPFKAQDADVVELVNQVRRYRNRVAHGRRDDPPTQVPPLEAFRRLDRFLKAVVAPEAEAAPP